MRALPSEFAAYAWAPSTDELAERLGLDPSEIVRFDGNVPAWPLPLSHRRKHLRHPQTPGHDRPHPSEKGIAPISTSMYAKELASPNPPLNETRKSG